MELQIQDLVSSIKKEGIEAAEKEKARILDEARDKAGQIIKQAKSEAAQISDETRRKLELEKESSIETAKQACRDLVISLKKELSEILEGLLAEKVKQTLGAQELGDIIRAALQNEDPSKYRLQASRLVEELKANLAAQIEKGLELKTIPGLEGFRLENKDGSGFYDFTDAQIAAILKPFIGNLNI